MSNQQSFDIRRDLVGHFFFIQKMLGILFVLVPLSVGFAFVNTEIKQNEVVRNRHGHVTSTLHGRNDSEFFSNLIGTFMGLGIPGAIGLRVLASAQARRLSYRLDGSTLYVEGGVVILVRSSIPLDRVTDFRLYQDLFMRPFGIWGIAVQTAGSPMPEAVMFGLDEPEKVRNDLIRERDAAARVGKA